MQEAILDLMRAYASIVVSDEATAEGLFDRAAAMHGQNPDLAVILRSAARQHRINAMEMRAKSAALEKRYDQLFRQSSRDL